MRPRVWLNWSWVCLAILVWLLVFTTIGQARGGQHYFRRYSSADGLSQAVVQAIFQDRSGYLWIGTQAGLNRYDGTSFNIYSIRQGIANDWINAIDEDDRGRLWLATLGGVTCWDRARFQNYTTADGLVDNRVSSLVVDRNGFVWCGTPRGLSRYDGHQWRTYGTAEGLPAENVKVLLVDHAGRVMAGTSGGLAHGDGERFVASHLPELLNNDIRALTEDRQHRLWVGLTDGVRVYERGHLIRVYVRSNGLNSLPVTKLCVDRYGITWVGTSQGLGAIEGSHITFFTAGDGLPHADVRSVYEDREGVLWIGVFGGLYKFQGRAFSNFGTADGLGSASVRPVLRDRRGILWVGTTGGLSRFDGRTWRNYTVTDGLTDDAIMALLEDSSGRLWVATRSGLNTFDGSRFRKDSTLPASGSVVAIVEDRSGVIWCAVQPVGLFRRVGQRFEPVTVEGQTFSNGRLLVDHRGAVWASGDNGLSRWSGGGWRTFTTTDGLADNQPYFLCEDRNGRIWFGYHSSRGLTSFDGTNFQHFTSAQGLANDAVYSLGEDGQGSLWIGTARGVDHFDGRTFTNYGTEEGYADDESNAGGFFADGDGTLWFGTAGGLSHYDPRFDLTRGDPPPVKLTDLRLGDRRFSSDTTPTVGYAHNELVARVVSLSFINEKRLAFQYRLIGFQEAWSPLEGHEIHITNLSSNQYRLEVRARKYQGPWSQPVQVGFTIMVPCWQTWWFSLLGFTLVASAVYSGHRFQTARVRRRANQLEQKVEERTRELAQKTEELESFIYTISHDLKAPVISLQGLAGLLGLELAEGLKEKAAFYLERIHANTIHMQRLITELLGLSRIGRVKEPKQSVALGDLVQEVLNELQGQIELKGAMITVADDLPIVTCQRDHLQKVWMNLVANALYYSRPGAAPVIEIGERNGQRNSHVFFVRDNGIGIASEHQEKVFEIFYRVQGKYSGSESTGVGLAIVKRIIESHGGRVWVESKGQGKGSTFWLTLPKETRGNNGNETHHHTVG